MRLEDFHFLLTQEGQRYLGELGESPVTADSHLQLATKLRGQVGSEQAHAVLETAMLRHRAREKFSLAEKMYFTQVGLQQATSEVVSDYRSRRYRESDSVHVADLGCGIGGDALSLTSQQTVTGVDWHPLHLAMAQENVRVYNHGERFRALQADLLELSPLPVDALFADPGRRDEYGRRISSVYRYRPPLGFLEHWRKRVPNQGVKISPGVDYNELPPDAEVEFISFKGVVREAVLWFGGLRSDAGRRATILPGGHTLTDKSVSNIPVIKPRKYLYEPDGAVIRAHLVQQLAHQIEASKIDPDIAYLTTDRAQSTPFAKCFVLDDVFPFQLKKLRHYLRQRNVGKVTIKKRGSPLDPDALRHRLRLRGDEFRVIFLTHVLGEPMVLIGMHT
jgi:SAM-dependent methyltransferase